LDNIYIKTEVTEITNDYVCELEEFFDSIDIVQFLIEVTLALIQKIAGLFCSASCQNFAAHCGQYSYICGLVCAAGCVVVEYYDEEMLP